MSQGLRRAVDALAGVSGADARLEAEVLLAHATGFTRTGLYRELARPINKQARQRYEALVERRLRHEPLAYIVGHKEFYGLDLLVDRRVLIPRPETEMLVEIAVERLRDGPCLIADIGTGSGALAVALATHLPKATVYAVDSSHEALEVARENVRRHGMEARVLLLHGDLLEPLAGPVDAIVANLPYIPSARLAGLQPEVAQSEPLEALDGGADGLAVYRRLLALSPVKLRPGGFLLAEIDAEQSQAAKTLAALLFPTAMTAVIPDYAGLPRVLSITMPCPDASGREG